MLFLFLVDESQLSNEDLDALEEGLDYVYGVIGQDVPLTDVEIKEALWYYYFDKDETVNWALGKYKTRIVCMCWLEILRTGCDIHVVE